MKFMCVFSSEIVSRAPSLTQVMRSRCSRGWGSWHGKGAGSGATEREPEGGKCAGARGRSRYPPCRLGCTSNLR
eukprot:3014497-Rhodomonas_salina.1